MKANVSLISSFACSFLSLVLCGCPQTTESTKEVKKLPFEGVKLKLQVVADPPMAKAIERLRGEWSAQSGSDFELVQTEEKEFSATETLAADAVICSSQQFALLAENKQLAELPEKIQNSTAWSDTFHLPKIREAAWAGKIYGLPFGSPVFTIQYRADLLKKLNQAPPKTWGEYQKLAQLLAAEKTSTPESPWHGTLEPLAPGWAGQMLLARAAPYAKHRDKYATWFDAETMEPLIAQPPVVQSLTRIVVAAKTNAGASLACDPAAVRRTFWAGQCGMAITWPTAADQNAAAKDKADEKSAANPGGFEVGFIELPTSRQVYNAGDQRWEARGEDESPAVPYLGLAGRIGAVHAKSPSAEAAFALLAWLSDNQNAPQICPASSATTLFRKTQLSKPQLWTEKELAPSAAVQYAESTAATLNQETSVDLRLPGREEYLAALDEAVQAAVEGKSPPAEAIQQVAEKWRKITEKHGKDRQKAAYLHSLGLD